MSRLAMGRLQFVNCFARPDAAVVVGVDVGSTSARAGVFSLNGVCLGSSSIPFETWTYDRDVFVEQSSEDIWRAVCASVQTAVKEARRPPQDIVGIGFDATCSLVALDAAGGPVSVSRADQWEAGETVRDVIVWMDHRATGEAMVVNATKHAALRSVGGAVSPEMQVPKVLWLQGHLPKERFAKIGRLMDLTDYLTARATGATTRSLCTGVCKWNLQADAAGHRWDASFVEAVGLKEAWARIDVGDDFKAPGETVGHLSKKAAADLGLGEACVVAVGLIDAHAGTVGCVGAPMMRRIPNEQEGAAPHEKRLALIAGTSCCHLASSPERFFAPGVWGPYYGAMLPGLYLHEGGQTAAGKLLDYVTGGALFYGGAARAVAAEAAATGRSKYEVLDARLGAMMRTAAAKEQRTTLAHLAARVHVDPDFFGNRAPLSDPGRRGAILGLRGGAFGATNEEEATKEGLDDLAVLYLATVQALAYQTRHIVEVLVAAGHAPFESVVATGGLAHRSSLFLQTTADALGLPVALADTDDAVLLGAAVIAAAAAKKFDSLFAAMDRMTRTAATCFQPDAATRALHDAKYRTFHKLQDLQQPHEV